MSWSTLQNLFFPILDSTLKLVNMSSFSQFSDAGPSSLAGNELYEDSFTHLDPPSITEIPDSQRSLVSTQITDFLSPPSSAPQSLQRGGPPKQKVWVIWTEMNKTEFIQWWMETQPYDTQKKMHWDAKRTSDVWQDFDQVAHHTTGEPRVLCRNCGRTLPHPNVTQNGTSALKRHLSTGACKRLAHERLWQKDIPGSFDSVVSLGNPSWFFDELFRPKKYYVTDPFRYPGPNTIPNKTNL